MPELNSSSKPKNPLVEKGGGGGEGGRINQAWELVKLKSSETRGEGGGGAERINQE